MPEPLAHRCARESAARGEPLAGTASRVRRWMVVEQPGAWGHDAVTHSGLDADVGRALADAARAAGVRVLLARRPGWQRAGEARRVFLAHSGAGARWLEQVDLPTDDQAALLALDLRALARAAPPGLGEPGPSALVLVCTNGRHDPCCADHGRPIVRRFAALGVADVWECSHVGGDRFAGNLVFLPDGVYVGRVDADAAPGLVADYRRGLLDLGRYRGRSFHPPLVQVAEVHARTHLDERRLDGVTVVAAEASSNDEATVHVAQRDGPTVEVVVIRRPGDPVHLTCRAPRPAVPWRYEVRTTRVLGPTGASPPESPTDADPQT
ncbi:MAG TPA: sucrase ferredoxin [Acidimicrobiales bacterium]